MLSEKHCSELHHPHLSFYLPDCIMSDTTAGVLADLAVARKTLDEWECGPMAIDVCTSLSNDITKSINFTETIGHGKKAPRSGKRDDGNCYWLKAEWNQNDDNVRQTLIIPYFVGVASHAGCRIHGSWDPDRQCIRFQCFRSKKTIPNTPLIITTPRSGQKKTKTFLTPPCQKGKENPASLKIYIGREP